jgi:hypothetical protein
VLVKKTNNNTFLLNSFPKQVGYEKNGCNGNQGNRHCYAHNDSGPVAFVWIWLARVLWTVLVPRNVRIAKKKSHLKNMYLLFIYIKKFYDII